jgi:hypothetical protein
VLSSPRRRRAPVPGPLGGVAGLLAGVAAECLAWTAGASAVTTTGVVLGSAAAAAVGATTDVGGAALAALLCWAFADGFALHRFGELHLGPADRNALVAVAAVGAVGYLAGAVRRRTRAGVALPATATAIALRPVTSGHPASARRPVGTGGRRLCP